VVKICGLVGQRLLVRDIGLGGEDRIGWKKTCQQKKKKEGSDYDQEGGKIT